MSRSFIVILIAVLLGVGYVTIFAHVDAGVKIFSAFVGLAILWAVKQ